MKHVLATVLLSPLFLVGCGSDTKTLPLATISTSQGVSLEEAYTRFVRSKVPSAYKVSDAELIRLGNGLCLQLYGGKTQDDVLKTVTSFGFSDDDATVLIGGAIGAFCPSKIR